MNPSGECTRYEYSFSEMFSMRKRRGREEGAEVVGVAQVVSLWRSAAEKGHMSKNKYLTADKFFRQCLHPFK